MNVSPKLTFLDQVFKREKRLPGPTTYAPYAEHRKSQKAIQAESPPRITIFDELTKQQKKMNYPAAGKYDRVENKNSKSKSGMSKVEVCT